MPSSTMALDDAQVTGRQGVGAAEVALRKIIGDAHEGVALLGAEQARRLGDHPQCSERTGARAQGRDGGIANLSQ